MRLWEVRDAGEGGTEPWKPEITQHLKLTHTNDTAPLVRRGTDGHARAFYWRHYGILQNTMAVGKKWISASALKNSFCLGISLSHCCYLP